MVDWIYRTVLLLALASGPAYAQEEHAGNAAAGEEFAREWCASCHKVEPGETGISGTGAPSFQDRANDPAVTELYLRTFFRTPHFDMPNFRLKPDQTDDLVAYILSLKGK